MDVQCWRPQSIASLLSNVPDPLFSDLVFLECTGDQAVSLCSGSPLSINLWSWYSRFGLPISAPPWMLEIENLRSHPRCTVKRSPGDLCAHKNLRIAALFTPWLGSQAPLHLAQLASQPYFLFLLHSIFAKQTLTSVGLCSSCYLSLCAHSSHLCMSKPYPCFKVHLRCNLFQETFLILPE